MNREWVSRFVRTAVVLAVSLLSTPAAWSAPQSFQITIDTSSVAGTGVGGIGLQFNPTLPPPPPGAESASASLTNFSSDGTAFGATIPFVGDVSGDLSSGTLVINNSTAFNLAFQPFDFGNTLSVDVTFSGDALNPPTLSTQNTIFAMTLLNSAGMPVLAGDATGAAVSLRVNPDGTITTVTQNPAVTVSVNRPMPEPTSMVIMGIGLAAMSGFGYRRLRRKQRDMDAKPLS